MTTFLATYYRNGKEATKLFTAANRTEARKYAKNNAVELVGMPSKFFFGVIPVVIVNGRIVPIN